MTRRRARDWVAEHTPRLPEVEVLIPTGGRRSELAVTLAGLAAQDEPPFDVIISDQADDHPMATEPATTAMIRVLTAQGHLVHVHRHTPRRGLAEHRAFLLAQATAPLVLFLDDDVWLEPDQLAVLVEAITELGCGTVGMAVQGLADHRPQQQAPSEPPDPPRSRHERRCTARRSEAVLCDFSQGAPRIADPGGHKLPVSRH